MNIDQINERIAELGDIELPFIDTLETTKKELVEAKLDTRILKKLEEIKTFTQAVIEGSEKTSAENKAEFVISAVKQLNEYLQNEIQKIQSKVIVATERVSVLENTVSFLQNRSKIYLGKRDAIVRVLEGTGDPRHPEKISTIREAEKVKKQKKDDS